jgi:integrase
MFWHMRRWRDRKIVTSHFVEWRGLPVKSVKNGFAAAVELAGLDLTDGNVTPHTLRHTAATWLMQNAAPLWEAAGFLGMSPETLKNVYGHHHLDFMAGAAKAIVAKPKPVNRLSKRLSRQ